MTLTNLFKRSCISRVLMHVKACAFPATSLRPACMVLDTYTDTKPPNIRNGLAPHEHEGTTLAFPPLLGMADSNPDQPGLPRTTENAGVTHDNATVLDSAVQVNAATVHTFKHNTAPSCLVQIDGNVNGNLSFNIPPYGDFLLGQPSPTSRGSQPQAPLPGSSSLHENASATPSGSRERLQSRSQPSLNENIELSNLNAPIENQHARHQRQELAYPEERGSRRRCYIILGAITSIIILVAAIVTPVAITVEWHKHQHQQSTSVQSSSVTSSQDSSQAATPSIPSIPWAPWTSSNTSSQLTQSIDTTSRSSTLSSPSSNTARTTSTVPTETLPTSASASTSSYAT
jgi:hypothetical protein